MPDQHLAVGRPLEGEGVGVVLALVAGEPPGEVAGTVDPRRRTDVRLHREGARAVEGPSVGRRGGRRPDVADPVALVLVQEGGRAGRRPHEDLDPVVLRRVRAAQPVVEPGDHLDVEVDPRPGVRRRGVGVHPRSGEQPVRHARLAQRRDGAERVVAVAVGPAGDQHHRALDPVVAVALAVGPQGAVPPVGTVAVLAQPGEQPRLDRLEPAAPLVAPAVAPDLRHRRQHRHRRHVVVVVDEVDHPQRAAAPVHVVGPPVVAGVDRADGLERRRPLGGDLQRVEAGVRRAPHADVAVAPVLVGQPRDHRDQVGLLGLRVLVRGVAGRRAGAADVDPAHGVPELVAEPPVALGVRRRQVVLAIGQRLQQARLRPAVVVGEEERGCQLDPVRHGDADLGLSCHARALPSAGSRSRDRVPR